MIPGYPVNIPSSVQLEDVKNIIIGGSSNGKGTSIYDPETSAYTDGPDMLFDHENFGCAHFYSQKHGERPVVLVLVLVVVQKQKFIHTRKWYMGRK